MVRDVLYNIASRGRGCPRLDTQPDKPAAVIFDG